MGAYHAVNFFFRHPDVFNALIALSGLYQLSMFVGDYSDENVYFNTPLASLPNLHDPWYIDQYRQAQVSDPVYTAARANRQVGPEKLPQGRAGQLPQATLSA
jgi:esterase/lipase superfamily enzyme